MARLAAIFDLMFMVLSPLWDLWRTGMVLMAIGRTRTGKVQRQGGAPCGLCEKSQGFTRLWVNASQTPKGRDARPFAIDVVMRNYCAVIFGCEVPCPVAEAVGDCTARIA